MQPEIQIKQTEDLATREALENALEALIRDAPRAVALQWAAKCLLPLLEKHRQNGGSV